MKLLLTVTAVIEAGAGVAFAFATSAVWPALLGSPLDSSANLLIGRILGAALFSLGVICWFVRDDVRGRTALGLISAMLLYNLSAASLLGYARIGLGIAGAGLWPGAVLHTVMAVWCVGYLRIARRSVSSRTDSPNP